MGKIKVSIIVPVYNVEGYLEECIDSIVNQSLQEIEIILVDDGSSDNSPVICDKYSEKDKRVRTIHIQNSGNVAARREGIKIAQGEYIGFVDSDDWIDKSMFEELYYNAVLYSADVVTSGFLIEDSNTSFLEKDAFPCGYYDKQSLYEVIYPDMIEYKNTGAFGIQTNLWCKIFKRCIISDTFMEMDQRVFYGEDGALVYASMLQADSIYITDKSYYHYRRRQNSVSNVKNIKIFESNVYFYEYMKRKLQEQGLFDLISAQLTNFMLRLNNHALQMYCDMSIRYKPFYQFPFDRVPKGSRIVLYGAGDVGSLYYRQIEKLNLYSLVGWVDENYRRYLDKGLNVVSPQVLEELEFDYLIVAIKKNEVIQEIVKFLQKKDIPQEKIIFGEISILKNVKVTEYA